MKKYLSAISIFIIVIGIIALSIWYSDKDSSLEQLARLDIYSKEELSFLQKEGFLDDQIVSLLKSPDLIEQDLNSPDESFEVLATKLDKDTYQLAFRLENKSNESKEFYLIPITKQDQAEFQEIKGVINSKNLLSINKEDVKKEPLESLYDIKQHKKELNPQLAQAYDDIDHNNYQAKPIKITLAPNSTLLAKSKWKIIRGPTSDNLEPVYLLVYGSAGGAKDELVILNVHSHPQQGDDWNVEFTTRSKADLKIIPVDQATIDDDEFTGLYCGDIKMNPQILAGDIIYYPNWECNETGKVVHYTLRAGHHTLRFEFEDQIEYAYNSPDVIDNLIGYWKLDDNLDTSAVLDAHASFDGTVVNDQNNRSSEQSASGQINTGFALDGTNDYVSIPSTVMDDMETANAFTISAWVYNTNLNQDATVVGQWKASSNQFLLWMDTGGVGDGYVLIVCDSDASTTVTSTDSVNAVADTWQHVVATWDGTTAIVYVDGDLKDSAEDARTIRSAALPAGIGSDEGASAERLFLGTIDEVGIWNRALTEEEITELYNSGDGLAYPFATNSAPTISSVEDYPDPEEVGNDVTFSVDWNDADGEGIKMLVCKSNAITAATPACDGGEWCSNKNDYDSTDPIACTYTTQSADIGSQDYYVFVCDNEPECSSSTSGTFTVEATSNSSLKFDGGIYFKGGTTIK